MTPIQMLQVQMNALEERVRNFPVFNETALEEVDEDLVTEGEKVEEVGPE